MDELADTIRPGGLANTKAARIHAILREVHHREGRYDLSGLAASRTRRSDYLSSLPGVGPKTVAVVMAFAFGRETIPVDTHVHRVATRLGLVPKTSAEQQRLLEAAVADPLKTPLHMGLIELGREICKAGRPRLRGLPALRAVSDGAGRPRNRAGSGEAIERAKSNPRFKLGKACVLPLNHARVARPGAEREQSSHPAGRRAASRGGAPMR